MSGPIRSMPSSDEYKRNWERIFVPGAGCDCDKVCDGGNAILASSEANVQGVHGPYGYRELEVDYAELKSMLPHAYQRIDELMRKTEYPNGCPILTEER